jgi:hypothetical protein
MKSFVLGSYAVAAMLAGCGGTSPTLGPPFSEMTAGTVHRLFAYDVLYSFLGAPKDGEDPNRRRQRHAVRHDEQRRQARRGNRVRNHYIR